MADILIRGMEMPKTCGDCPLSALRMDCKLTGRDISHDWMKRKIPDWCPLVPLPEGHGRLVDADALVADTSFFDGGDWHYGYSAKQIQNAPTILEAEGGLRNDS